MSDASFRDRFLRNIRVRDKTAKTEAEALEKERLRLLELEGPPWEDSPMTSLLSLPFTASSPLIGDDPPIRVAAEMTGDMRRRALGEHLMAFPQAITASFVIWKDGTVIYAFNSANGKIDYSGTDAATVIQAAIDAADALGGGLIHISMGTYTITTSILYRDYMIIEGEGWKTILTLADGVDEPVITGGGGYLEDRDGNDNLIIRNLAIDGNKDNQTNIAITFGIDVGGLRDGLIENCHIYDCKLDAIIAGYGGHYIRSNDRITIKNNRLEDCGRAGIVFTYNAGIWIENNYIKDCTGGRGIHGEASLSGDTIEDVYIKGNIIDGCGGGIEVAPMDYSSGVYIENNTLKNMSDLAGGIILYKIRGFHIIGNDFNDVGKTATDDPTHYYYRPIGMRLSGPGSIIANSFRGCDQDDDIYLYDSNRVNVIGNEFYTATTDYFALRLEGVTTRNTFLGNFVHHGTNAVIENGASVDHNYVLDNVLLGQTVTLTGANSIVRRNIGYITENNVLSDAFAIDAVTTVTVTIAHGLSVTPTVQDCQLTIIEDTNVDDWGYELVKVESVGATNVVCKVNVTTASSTGSATAKLALRIIT